MSQDTEFREELKRIVRMNDPSAEELRKAADRLNDLADKWDVVSDTL